MSDKTAGLRDEIETFLEDGRFHRECLALRGLTEESRQAILDYPNQLSHLLRRVKKIRYMAGVALLLILPLLLLPGNFKLWAAVAAIAGVLLFQRSETLRGRKWDLGHKLRDTDFFYNCKTLLEFVNLGTEDLHRITGKDEDPAIRELSNQVVVHACQRVLQSRKLFVDSIISYGDRLRTQGWVCNSAANVLASVREVANQYQASINAKDRVFRFFGNMKLLDGREGEYFQKARRLMKTPDGLGS